MTRLLATLFTYGAICVASLRWLRVAQREHYWPGRVTLFAFRWWKVRWESLVTLGLAVAMIFLSATHVFWGVGATVVIAFSPAGLTLKGRTSPLAWTPRLRRLAAVYLGIHLVLAVLSLLVPFGYTALVVTALISPVICDLALAIMRPIEKSLGEQFVAKAATFLAGVSPTVVAITGSYGKTTTKEYLRHIFSPGLDVFATPESFNNQMGLARAINEAMGPSTQVFIAEMGTYGPGEIAEMCSWVKPEVAVLTAIAPVHLERFKSIETTVRAKLEIAEEAETVVVCIDYPELKDRVPDLAEKATVIRTSTVDDSADVFVDESGTTIRVFVEGREIAHFPSAGRFASNIGCAVAAAIALGVDEKEIAKRLDSLPVAEHRLSVEKSDDGVMVIDDTYNSNPPGAAKALELLGRIETTGKRVVVTPGMVEFGPEQYQVNFEFAMAAATVADVLAIVGYTNRRALEAGAEAARDAVEGAEGAGGDGPGRAGGDGPGGAGGDGPGGAGVEIKLFETRDEAANWVRENLGAGDAVLYENDLPDHFP